MKLTAYFLKIISVLLQYGMLLILLMYLARLSRSVGRSFFSMDKELKQKQIEDNEAVIAVLDAPEETKLKGRRFAFEDGISIGRGEDNDIVILEGYVSHHHARITAHGNQYVIEDLGSRNHTYVNDTELMEKAYLSSGDEIRIGYVVLRFER